MQSINAQFAHPRGIVGYLVGMVMAYENRERIAWAVNHLDVQPGDHILEIGFGPGVAIRMLSKMITTGSIAGVDSSAVMVQLARRQNRSAILSGKAHLRQGSVEALPDPQGSFDKAFAINSLHRWPDQAAGLRQLHRVLKPGGVLAIVEQPISSTSLDEAKVIAEELSKQLCAAGFQEIRCDFKPMRMAPAIYLKGIR